MAANWRSSRAAAAICLLIVSCNSERQRQTDLYNSVWVQFHATNPKTLQSVQKALGSQGQCSQARWYTCEWSLVTTAGPKHIEATFDGNSLDAKTLLIVFRDDDYEMIEVSTAPQTAAELEETRERNKRNEELQQRLDDMKAGRKPRDLPRCTCADGDPLCSEVPTVTCTP